MAEADIGVGGYPRTLDIAIGDHAMGKRRQRVLGMLRIFRLVGGILEQRQRPLRVGIAHLGVEQHGRAVDQGRRLRRHLDQGIENGGDAGVVRLGVLDQQARQQLGRIGVAASGNAVLRRFVDQLKLFPAEHQGSVS